MTASATKPSADRVFRAFADPTRLRILRLLQGGERCVCDLVAELAVPQPKVSRHLAYLRRAGLVTARRDGFWMHYQLSAASTAFHKKLLECLACCAGQLAMCESNARGGRARRAGSCASDDAGGGCC